MTEPVARLHNRVPPHRADAEMAVLGGVLLRNEALDQVRDRLEPTQFYLPAHQHLYRAICRLSEQHKAIDPVTLRSELKAHDRFDECGGAQYINRLLDEVHTTANIEEYAAIVADEALKRQTINAALVAMEAAYNGTDHNGREIEGGGVEIVTRLQAALLDIGRHISGPITDSQAGMEEVLSFVEERETSGRPYGYTTGFDDLDKVTGGLRAANMFVVGARPAMGKTSLALSFMRAVARHEKLPCLLFSMESSRREIFLRIAAAEARVDVSKIYNGQVDQDSWSRLASVAATIADENLIHVDDTSLLTPAALGAKARRFAAQHGKIGMVAVDYVQLLDGDKKGARRDDNRNMELTRISRQLKALAKDLNCPVVALAQLNRGLEARTDKRPRPADLRESGALEQDADVIVLLYRDIVYHPDTAEPNLCEAIVGKNRDGPVGKVKLSFVGEYTRFDNYAERGMW